MSDEGDVHSILTDAWEGLHEATDEASFRGCYATLLSHIDILPGEWRNELVRLATTPWKRSKGAPARIERLEHVEWEYFARHVGGLLSQRPRRKSALAEIAARYGMTDEAAGKLYDKASKSYAAKPYAIDGAVVHDALDEGPTLVAMRDGNK